MALNRGRLELIGFVYPPLPFLLLLPWPSAMLASLLAALAAGTLAWILWRRVVHLSMPVAVKALLVAAAMGTPTLLYLGSESMSETLALLLFVVAWSGFLKFTRSREARYGVVAGLGLGMAFFVNPHSALVVIPCALSAPLFMRERSWRGTVAVAFLLIFPVLIAVLAWGYLNWLFTGDPLTFTRGPANSLFVHWRPASEGLPVGWSAALGATTADLVMSPLYLTSAILVARYWPARLLVFAAPALLIVAVRTAGMIYSEYFAVATFSVVALVALHPRLPRRLWPLLALSAIAHLWMGYASPLRGEAAIWKERLLGGHLSDADREELSVGEYLAGRPPASIMLDDRTAYRIVARTGTARPFILPADPLYQVAESQPAQFMRYLLVPAEPSDLTGGALATIYVGQPPPGVRLARSWPNWRLYERVAPGGGDPVHHQAVLLRGSDGHQ